MSGLKIAAVAGGLLLVVQIVLLSLQLGILRDSREHIVAQDAKVTRLLETTEPVAEDARPLIRSARELVAPLREQGGEVARATGALPELAMTARTVAGQVEPMLLGLEQLIAQMLRRDLVGSAERAADDVHASRGIQGESLQTQRRTLAIQERTLRAQLQGLRIQREALRVARQTLRHAESIDRKTGGPVPIP